MKLIILSPSSEADFTFFVMFMFLSNMVYDDVCWIYSRPLWPWLRPTSKSTWLRCLILLVAYLSFLSNDSSYFLSSSEAPLLPVFFLDFFYFLFFFLFWSWFSLVTWSYSSSCSALNWWSYCSRALTTVSKTSSDLLVKVDSIVNEYFV
jgi:hypothetical protein